MQFSHRDCRNHQYWSGVGAISCALCFVVALCGCNGSGNDVGSDKTKMQPTKDARPMPQKIVMTFLDDAGNQFVHERVITKPDEISRVWSFVSSHLDRKTKMEAPAPYNLQFRCEMSNNEVLEIQYQEGEWGFRANDKHGMLTDDQRRTLTKIAKEFLGVEY